jgi:hypothetical protein
MGIKIERWPTDIENSLDASDSSVDSFTLTYDIQWDSVPVYGRQDAIHSYKATGQTVSFSFPITPNDINQLSDITRTLSSLTRPVYDKGYIKRSPIIRVTLLKGSSFYLDGPFLMAPTSLSVDYGDRIRNIQSQIYGTNTFDSSKDLLEKIPAKLLITISGPIIHQEIIYQDMTSLNTLFPITDESLEKITEANIKKITESIGKK